MNDRQRAFVGEYLATADLNATEAARRAGYSGASAAAAKLMKNTSVRKAIREGMRRRGERLEIKADRVLQELARIAFRDPIDLCDENGQVCLDDLREIPENARRTIEAIKTRVRTVRGGESGDSDGSGQDVEVEMRFAPKIAALELLMKHLGMFAPEKKSVHMSLDPDLLFGTGDEGPDDGDDPIERAIEDAG